MTQEFQYFASIPNNSKKAFSMSDDSYFNRLVTLFTLILETP